MNTAADAHLNTDSANIPPHSIEAEQAVLGGVLLDNNTFHIVQDQIIDTDFYRKEHSLIFQAIVQLIKNQDPVDVITLDEHFQQSGNQSCVGGLAYLIKLAKNTPSIANIDAYAKIIRSRAILRDLITKSGEISNSAFRPQGKSVESILDIAEQKIFSIADKRTKGGGATNINTLLTQTVERIDTLFNSKNSLTGLSTGYIDLDELTCGLQKSDLIIVAGRPSMGKTTFAMNLVEHAVVNQEKNVLVYSLEMPGDSLIMRMLSSLGRINQTSIRTGRLIDDDWPRLTSAIHLLNDKNLFIDDTAGISVNEIRSRSRRLIRDIGSLDLIVIDYLQLMKMPEYEKENRNNQISEISRSLKGLAKEFNCPVVALSQLNRGLEQRPNKRPVNADLRDSGAIEQDADVIMFVYRDEVYHPDTDQAGVAEIIIGKQRNGPIGTTRLAFSGKHMRFDNLASNNY